MQSQLTNAIEREDYEEAARIKVAIAAAARSDTVGRVMSHLKVVPCMSFGPNLFMWLPIYLYSFKSILSCLFLVHTISV